MVLRKRSVHRVYELGERFACGGMSELYEAQMDGSRKVAVKRLVLPSQEDEIVAQGFFREAAVLGSMDHPNIVELIDAGESRDNFFLVMEYLDGISLQDLINYLKRHNQRLELDLAFGILGQVARGLSHAHSRAMPDGSPLGVLHRDIAPENILVTRDGVPKLIDFGIATLRGFEITAPGVIRGHSKYMSPEQARTEEIDARSDVFSLGAVLFELLTLEPLYQERQEAALLWKVQQGDYPELEARLRGEEKGLVEIISKSVASDRKLRYRNAREFERELDRFRAARGLRVDHRSIAETVKVIAKSLPKQKKGSNNGELRNSQLRLDAEDSNRPGSFSSPHMMAITEQEETSQKRLPRLESAGLARPPSLDRPSSPARLNSVLARQETQKGILIALGVLTVIGVALGFGYLLS